mmetsp:Transcript_18478/g.41323  ORF Transcript_18478/g.41323 Transcript_18478/m.41323 type:complete len:266 (+) Transcript_18478:2330-3127(+)
MPRVRLLCSCSEALVASLGHLALGVEEGEDTGRRLFEQLDDLRVVRVVERGDLQILHAVELDLDLEDAHQEKVVKPLVGIVNAELLERVGLEDLESKDIEQPDELVEVLLHLDVQIHPCHDQVEKHGVDVLHESIALVRGRIQIERDMVLALRTRRVNDLLDEELAQVANSKQALRLLLGSHGGRAYLDGVVGLRLKLDVADVENGSTHLERVKPVVLGEIARCQAGVHLQQIFAVVDSRHSGGSTHARIREVVRFLSLEAWWAN